MNNTNPSSLVSDPTNALQGTYFVFGKDSNGFYSEGVQVQLVCNASGSCSAPQTLTVVPAFGSNLIQFQSAAYPPPLNSYTVKRRLSSDPDIAGSYTTIGTPAWNPSASRWVINDVTAVPNVLYTYRAISNCGSTAPYIDREFANIICPVVELTGRVTEVDYSFAPIGGQISKVEVSIYSDASGIDLVHTNTHLPAFSNPIIGTFLYLDPPSTYYVRVKAFIGTYSKTCDLQPVNTLSDTATLIADYIAGTWLFNLSSALPNNITAKTAVATGSQDLCVTPLEVDTLAQDVLIPAGSLGNSVETNGITYLSTYYKLTNAVQIDGYGSLANGATFNVGGVTVTLQINHLVCGFYPA